MAGVECLEPPKETMEEIVVDHEAGRTMSDGPHDADTSLTLLRNSYLDAEKEVSDTLKHSSREVFCGYETLLRDIELKYVEEHTKKNNIKYSSTTNTREWRFSKNKSS